MNDVPERTVYRIAYITLAATAAVLILSGVIAFLVLLGNNTSSDIQQSTKRTDCRSSYNADFTVALREREGLVAKIVVASVQNDRAQIGDLSGKIDALNREIDSYPKLDDAVNDGFTLHGVKYPPCPG